MQEANIEDQVRVQGYTIFVAKEMTDVQPGVICVTCVNSSNLFLQLVNGHVGRIDDFIRPASQVLKAASLFPDYFQNLPVGTQGMAPRDSLYLLTRVSSGGFEEEDLVPGSLHVNLVENFKRV